MNPNAAPNWRGDKPSRANTVGSVRGKPISNPIPIPVDDEFPIRTPGTGIALPMGDALEREVKLRNSLATEELHPTRPPPGLPPGRELENEIPAQTTTFTTEEGSLNEDIRRARQQSTMRDSVAASAKSRTSVQAKPERKKSSFKSVLGRLFGKKKKPVPSPLASKPNADLQHRSDPTALNRKLDNRQGSGSKRSASLPINEFNRGLRSHSIMAADIPDSVKSSLKGDFVQSNLQGRPRQANTPSRLWTPNKTPGYVDWTGLSPRPASTHARGSVIINDTEENFIGTAVTSGSHPHRRSRSLGELREAALGQRAPRRRSDEIKYWRESYDPTILSPLSSNRADADEPILLEEEDASDVRHAPPQPFNFGPLGALAGMKITEVASLETRVQRLEDRMSKMERMMSRGFENFSSEQLHYIQQPPPRKSPPRATAIPAPKNTHPEVSRPRSSRHDPNEHEEYHHEPMPQFRSSSYGSNTRRPSTNTSYEQPGIPTNTYPSDSTLQNFSSHNARPLSTSTTIRGQNSPSTSRDGALTAEHFTTLTNLILAEQTARQNLELLVMNLQSQVRALSSHGPPPHSRSQNKHDHFSSFDNDDDESSNDDHYLRENEDVFQTPSEEHANHNFSDQIFGDVLRNSASEQRGTRGEDQRTLSLSRVTMGKGLGGRGAGAGMDVSF